MKALATFTRREQLRDINRLVLPEILYTQLFAEVTKYTIENADGTLEKRHDVGLRSYFEDH